MTLFLALKIASVHLDNKDYGTAAKFLDRITTSYRKDNFEPMTETALVMYYETLKCALQPLSQATMAQLDFGQFERFLYTCFELLSLNYSTVPVEIKVDICERLKMISQVSGRFSMYLRISQLPY